MAIENVLYDLSFTENIKICLANLLSYTNTGVEPSSYIKDIADVHIIYLHALQSGLLRVKMQGPIGRYSNKLKYYNFQEI